MLKPFGDLIYQHQKPKKYYVNKEALNVSDNIPSLIASLLKVDCDNRRIRGCEWGLQEEVEYFICREEVEIGYTWHEDQELLGIRRELEVEQGQEHDKLEVVHG
jgi:hypothetical protein